MNGHALVKKTISFWFKGLNTQKSLPTECLQLWFGGNAEVDAQISNEFGASVESFLQQDLAEIQQWALNLGNHSDQTGQSDNLNADENVIQGVLTAVLHLDQFTRNIFRGSGRAFSGDAKALGLTRWAIERGLDRKAHPIHRSFLYLPLEHAETLIDQEESVRQFCGLRDEYRNDPAYAMLLQRFAKYAEEHRDIVVRFGRYPHRNRALGRESTADELEYLQAGNNSYGQ